MRNDNVLWGDASLTWVAVRLRLLQSIGPASISCPCCSDVLAYPHRPTPMHTSIFNWQAHMGKCGGRGRCLQAHKVVKLAIKSLIFSCPDRKGIDIPSKHMLIEPRHMRSDTSSPWDLYAMARGLYVKDASMDLTISLCLTHSCLLNTSRSSDYVLSQGETLNSTRAFVIMSPFTYLLLGVLFPLSWSILKGDVLISMQRHGNLLPFSSRDPPADISYKVLLRCLL